MYDTIKIPSKTKSFIVYDYSWEFDIFNVSKNFILNSSINLKQ